MSRENRAPKGPPDLSLTSVCLSSVQLQPPERTELPGDLMPSASSLHVVLQSRCNLQWEQSSQGTSWPKPHLCCLPSVQLWPQVRTEIPRDLLTRSLHLPVFVQSSVFPLSPFSFVPLFLCFFVPLSLFPFVLLSFFPVYQVYPVFLAKSLELLVSQWISFS